MRELSTSEQHYISGDGVVFFRDVDDGNVVGEPDRRNLAADRIGLSTSTGGNNITTLAFKHTRY